MRQLSRLLCPAPEIGLEEVLDRAQPMLGQPHDRAALVVAILDPVYQAVLLQRFHAAERRGQRNAGRCAEARHGDLFGTKPRIVEVEQHLPAGIREQLLGEVGAAVAADALEFPQGVAPSPYRIDR